MVGIFPTGEQAVLAPRRHRVPEGSRVYAVGDIHGRSDLLRRLHEMVLDDARETAPSRKVIVYLGDYVDRGWDSRGVIDLLLDEPLPGFEGFYLRGNHDDWLLEFLAGTGSDVDWLSNGGDTTLDSYGVVLPALAVGREDIDDVRRALREKLPRRHFEFLSALVLTHVEGDYLFVHAGIRPGVPLEEQDRDDLIWIREEFLESNVDHGKLVVHGHTPSSQVQVRANRIGIDTTAFASSRLTCLVLEDDERRFLQT